MLSTGCNLSGRARKATASVRFKISSLFSQALLRLCPVYATCGEELESIVHYSIAALSLRIWKKKGIEWYKFVNICSIQHG